MKQLAYITYDGTGGIDLGFITLHFYSLMWIIAFVLGLFIMKKMFRTDKVSLDLIDPLFLYTFIGTIVGARLGEYIFYNPSAFIETPLEVFLPVQKSPGDSAFFGLLDGYKFVGFMGLASHGATVGLLLAIYLFKRKYMKTTPFLWIVDRLAIPVAIGGAFVRIGNFLNSEIVGKPSDLPWAVLFKQQSTGYGPVVPRHPAQLYEAIGYVILFVILWFIYQKTDKKKYPGFIFGLFFTILWLIRFTVEFFKENQGVEWVADTLSLNLNNGQVLSIPFMIVGLIILFITNKKTKNETI